MAKVLGPIRVSGSHLPISDAVCQEIIHHMCSHLTSYNPLYKDHTKKKKKMDLKKKKDHTTQKERNRNEWFQQRLEKGSPKMREKAPGETHSIRATSDQRQTGKN